MLLKGEEVVLYCQVCRAPVHPCGYYDGRVCGRTCSEELRWRQALCITQDKLQVADGFASYEPKD